MFKFPKPGICVFVFTAIFLVPRTMLDRYYILKKAWLKEKKNKSMNYGKSRPMLQLCVTYPMWHGCFPQSHLPFKDALLLGTPGELETLFSCIMWTSMFLEYPNLPLLPSKLDSIAENVKIYLPNFYVNSIFSGQGMDRIWPPCLFSCLRCCFSCLCSTLSMFHSDRPLQNSGISLKKKYCLCILLNIERSIFQSCFHLIFVRSALID